MNTTKYNDLPIINDLQMKGGIKKNGNNQR